MSEVYHEKNMTTISYAAYDAATQMGTSPGDAAALLLNKVEIRKFKFVRVVQEAQSIQQTAEVKKQRTRLAAARQMVSELEVLLCRIYEDSILGKLPDNRYATLDAQYAKEQSGLTAHRVSGKSADGLGVHKSHSPGSAIVQEPH